MSEATLLILILLSVVVVLPAQILSVIGYHVNSDRAAKVLFCTATGLIVMSVTIFVVACSNWLFTR